MTRNESHAPDLRDARDRFLGGGALPARVRPAIAASWRRSAAAGLDPELVSVPVELTGRAASAVLRDHPLARFEPLLAESLGAVARASDHVVAVTDADGLVLAVDGARATRRAVAARLGMVAGARFSEPVAGTNALGIALATVRPAQVFAAEHYCAHSQAWACAAAPVRDRRTGALLGAINLTGPLETAHPHTIALVSATAALIELSWAGEDRPAAGAQLELAALGLDRAELRADGAPVRLSLRHSELLVLLAAHPDGLTAEQLALRLYGERGKPVSARAEVSRLRRILPGALDTDPYRLVAAPRTDLDELRAHLRAGDARAAAERHRGPLLPRSEAPGVIELRDELEGWTRRAVLASDDTETLWAWLRTRSGAEDLQAWRRLLAGLPPGDGRRGLAAARLERLRALLS